MEKTLALLVASTALTATFGLPASSASNSSADYVSQPFAAIFAAEAQPMPFVLISDDDDDDDDSKKRDHDRLGDDDDHDRSNDDDDDDDRIDGARNAAPAGTVAPPSNGLFGTGAPPKVQMN